MEVVKRWRARRQSAIFRCRPARIPTLFPQLARFTDLSLLLLRMMVALVFATSGWNHLKDPEGRSKASA